MAIKVYKGVYNMMSSHYDGFTYPNSVTMPLPKYMSVFTASPAPEITL